MPAPATSASVFGRFYVDTPAGKPPLDPRQRLAMVLECDDQHHYELPFDHLQPLFAVTVQPATCSWTETVFKDVNGAIMERKPAPAGEFKNVKIEAGQAYYVGDLSARVMFFYAEDGTVSRTQWNYAVIRHMPHRTGRDGLAAFPQLRAQSLQDKALWFTPPDFNGPGKDIEIPEADMRAEYDRYMASQTDTEYHSRHILVSSEAQAQVAMQRLAKGEAFESVVRDLSEDSVSRIRGGDIGWGVPALYAQPFGQALKQLKAGERSPAPVHTNFGWHIIEVMETRPNVQPDYEDVRDLMLVAMRAQRAKAQAMAARQAASAAASAAASSAQPAAAASSPAKR